MANLTSATGEVTISAPNRQTIKDILYIFDEYVSKWAYNTVIESDGYQIIENDQGFYTTTCSFYGNGRWSYDGNIDTMPGYIQEITDDRNPFNNPTEAFTIEFEYQDIEYGNDFLAEGYATYIKNSGSLDIDIENNYDSFDITSENAYQILGETNYIDATEFGAKMFIGNIPNYQEPGQPLTVSYQGTEVDLSAIYDAYRMSTPHTKQLIINAIQSAIKQAYPYGWFLFDEFLYDTDFLDNPNLVIALSEATFKEK